MRPDGTLERWDEKLIFNYKDEDYPGPKNIDLPTPRQKRYTTVDLDSSIGYIDECLQDNQGWHRQDPIDPWRVHFPYALYLGKGDSVYCLETKAKFKIVDVEEEWLQLLGNKRKMKTGWVRLTGRHEPDEHYRLRFPQENRIIFRHSYPKQMSQTYEFGEDGQLVRNPASWRDTITYMIVRKQPGATDGRPFGDRKEIKPRFRETIEKDDDKTTFRMVYGQWFESIVQFDLWAQTNERANVLLNWFEDFMDRYRWVLKWNGVQETFYWQRNEDALVSRWRNDIVHRTVEYYFRTDRIRAADIRRLVTMSLTIDVAERGTGPDSLFREIIDPRTWPNFYTGDIPVEIIDNKTGEPIIQY